MSQNIKEEGKEHNKIPVATKEQLKQIEASFIKTYGRSYNRMRKAELAVMVANQSSNFKKISEQAGYIATLGAIMQRQRDVFKNILRRRDGLEVKKKGLKPVVRNADGEIIDEKRSS
jgi:hypothetical protein